MDLTTEHRTCDPITLPGQEPERRAPPTVVAGRYQLRGLLGRGGMASVLHAIDLQTGESVAVKLLHANAVTPHFVQRLAIEAVTMRFLEHPHVARVRDMGIDEDSGLPFVVMDLAVGGSAAEALRALGPLPAELVAGWGVDVCSALAAAHAHGVVHRDVKPANILVDGAGRALLADFGVAWAADADLAPDHRVGTPSFMAPEQLLSADGVGPAADVYSLGAALFQLCTGRVPRQLFRLSPRDPAWQEVPGPLREAIVRATRVRAADRYPSARELALALLPAVSPEWAADRRYLRAWLSGSTVDAAAIPS